MAEIRLFDTRLVRSLKHLSKVCAGLSCLIGLAVLAGWVFGIDWLKGLGPGNATMKANSAFCFVLSGWAILLLHARPAARFSYTGILLSLLVSLTGALTLAEHFLNLSFFDLPLFARLDETGKISPFRMAATSAFCFMVSGLSLALFHLHKSIRFAQILSLFSMIIALLAIIGYLYGVGFLYTVGPYSTIALHTAVAFIFLSISILFTFPDRGIISIFSSADPGGLIARVLIPATILFPILIGWGGLMAEKAGWYESSFGLSITAIITIIIFTILIWNNAQAAHRVDIKRAAAEEEIQKAYAEMEERVKERTAELRESEDRFSTIFHSSPTGIAITRVSDGKLIDANESFAEMIGYHQQDVLNHTSIELGIWKNPADRQRIINKTIRNHSVVNEEFEFRKKSGEEGYAFFSGRMIQIHSEPCILWVLSDITAHKLANEKIRLIIDTAHDAFISMDSKGSIIDWNPAAESVFGWRRNDVIGNMLAETIIPEQHREAHKRGLKHFLETGEGPVLNKSIEITALRSDGKEIPVELSISALRTEFGYVFNALIRDISERKKSAVLLEKQAAELARSNAELEQFAYIASHDLQEPLRMVTSFLELLEARYKNQLDSDANTFIHFAVDGAARMRSLIQDLLSYSRIGKKEMTVESFPSQLAVEEALKNLRRAISETHANVTFENLPDIHGSMREFVQVFQNLIGNAIKFHSDQPPFVTISAEKNGKEFLFKITDNGIGIAQEFTERIFLPFQRLHTREEYPGTGIGLAICRKIVTRHGGRIWVHSSPGRSSTFFFTLPAREDAAKDASLRNASADSDGRRQPG